MKSTSVIILAAGQGSRLGELTQQCHKSLLPVQGEPLLLRTIGQLRRAQYYMAPWVSQLNALPCQAVDLSHCSVATFNTPEDYRRCEQLFAQPPGLQLIEVARLRHIEGFSSRRVAWLAKKISREGRWTKPLAFRRSTAGIKNCSAYC